MQLWNLGRPVAAAVLVLTLAGCLDYTTVVTVTSDSAAHLEIIEDWDPGGLESTRIYPPLPGESADAAVEQYCEDGSKVPKADGGMVCARVYDGDFPTVAARLAGGTFEDYVKQNPIFTVLAPGLVRVELSPAHMTEGLCLGFDGTPEQRREVESQIKEALGSHLFVIRVAGLEVVETNMELSLDRGSAEMALSHSDVVLCEITEKFFAVVRTK